MCSWIFLLVEEAAGAVPMILLVLSHCRGVLRLLALLLVVELVLLLVVVEEEEEEEVVVVVVVVAQKWLGLAKAALWRAAWPVAGAVGASSLPPPLLAALLVAGGAGEVGEAAEAGPAL